MQHVLLIGAGTMGKEHANSYYAMKDVRVVGIVDKRTEQAQEVIGDKDTIVFESIEEAVNTLEHIDVIDVCVPTFLHKEYVMKAADFGIDVICEKPLAYTLEDAKEMMDYCDKKQVKLFVGHVVRFFPQYAKAKELVANGAIGEIGVVRTRRGGNFPAGWTDWYSNAAKSGGVILDLIIHDFDFLRWNFGEVERVYAKGLPNLHYAIVTVAFQSGVIAHVEGSWVHQTFSTQFEFAGTNGIVDYDSSKEEPVFLSIKQSNGDVGGVQVPQSPLRRSPYFTELQHFLKCLKTNETPIVTAEDAYRAMEISIAALQSLKTGLPVTLGQKGEN
ncbi:Gfo/Idh/MocA family protein [Bacillus timonensis]|uniref:Gfo/Idh/MocA family protein n=1 Tax=Bacillus timonensis TaxID=1033734 RepID=UPI000287F61D|nr:Gfo/Idh/MocA family oxidoreductase [Bacillus timonensis]